MGKIDNFMDLTGSMDQTEVNSTQITQMVDELNRSQDLLDSFTSNLKIIATGQVTDIWNGSAGVGNHIDIPINTGLGFTFLGYYSRSDIPGSLYSIPNYLYDNSGNIQFYVFNFSNQQNLTMQWYAYQAGTSFTWTFYYFILQQPTNTNST